MQISEDSQKQPAFNIPAPVLWLLAGLAVAHIVRVSLPPEQGLQLLFDYALIPANYSQDFLTAHNMSAGTFWDQAVPFVSYMALHGDFTHLGVNLIWLLAFGPVVARRFGTGRFLLFFVLCGVAGAVTHLATNWGSPSPVIGASAAISGLMAAGIRMLPVLRIPFDPEAARHTPLAPLWARQALIFSGIWMLMNAIVGMTGLGAAPDGEIRLIAWQAHMGGYLAGYLLAGPFDRLVKLQPA